MSYSKRILFGDNPADDGIRQQIVQRMEQWLEPFKFTIPMRRRNRLNVGPHWDSWWPSIIASTAKELKIDFVRINDQLCFKTQAEAEEVRVLSEKRHRAEIEKFLATYKDDPQYAHLKGRTVRSLDGQAPQASNTR
jgi:hypothetical protein